MRPKSTRYTGRRFENRGFCYWSCMCGGGLCVFVSKAGRDGSRRGRINRCEGDDNVGGRTEVNLIIVESKV